MKRRRLRAGEIPEDIMEEILQGIGRMANGETVLVAQDCILVQVEFAEKRRVDHWDDALPQAAFALPITIVILRPFLQAIPNEIDEAAQIDGCSKAGAFWRITFPLLAPGLVSTGIFAFIQAWNEFVFALVIMTREESQTLPIWLRSFLQATKATDWSVVMAGSTLMALPVVVFFLIVQGRMTSSMTSGAVKG